MASCVRIQIPSHHVDQIIDIHEIETHSIKTKSKHSKSRDRRDGQTESKDKKRDTKAL